MFEVTHGDEVLFVVVYPYASVDQCNCSCCVYIAAYVSVSTIANILFVHEYLPNPDCCTLPSVCLCRCASILSHFVSCVCHVSVHLHAGSCTCWRRGVFWVLLLRTVGYMHMCVVFLMVMSKSDRESWAYDVCEGCVKLCQYLYNCQQSCFSHYGRHLRTCAKVCT